MLDDLYFKDRTAVVTGASRGIGKAIALALGRGGANLIVTARKEGPLREAVSEFVDSGIAAEYYIANAADPTGAEECLRHAEAKFGPVTILVNNAGTNPHYGPLLQLDESSAAKTAQVNMFGPIAWTQAAWRHGLAKNGGAILNIASAGASVTSNVIGYYNATKAALIHLTQELAAELAPSVRVNAIAPGLVKTQMARALWESQEEELALQMPLGRLGLPTDIAELASFLLSDRSSWITGQTIAIDGGQLIRNAGQRHNPTPNISSESKQ